MSRRTTRSPHRGRGPIAFALASTMILAIVVTTPSPVEATTQRCEERFTPLKPAGVGDEASPYLIASPANLTWITSNQFNRDLPLEEAGEPRGIDVRSAHYEMTNDIDLQGCRWRPIGQAFGGGVAVPFIDQTLQRFFGGVFDGGGFAIRGLNVEGNEQLPPHTGAQEEYRGFFGAIRGEVRDLRLIDVKVTVLARPDNASAAGGAGAVAGLADGAVIERVSASGHVSGIGFVGGLIGLAYSETSVAYSRSSVDVTLDLRLTAPPDSAAGGLVGTFYVGSISDSYSLGTMRLLGTENFPLGGLVGSVAYGTASIESSFAVGAIPEGVKSGGLFGSVGEDGVPTYLASRWDVLATGVDSTAGGTLQADEAIGLTTAQMKSFATFGPVADGGAGWPIVNGAALFDPSKGQVWGICATVNDGYPFLLWEIDSEVCPPPPPPPTPDPVPSFVLSPDGSLPSAPVATAAWQQADGTTVPLAVTSPAPGQVRYEAPGVQLTLTGSTGTDTSRGLVANPNGEVECEICATLAAGGVIEVWMFSEPRLVAAWRVEDLPCQRFTIPVGTPLDGGGSVVAGTHTLHLALPTAAGMQAVNVGVTVGGAVPTSVPAGDGGLPLGARLFLIAVALGGAALVTLRSGRRIESTAQTAAGATTGTIG